jgi:hypothetical protein
VAGVIDAAHERHLVSTASAVPFGARRWRTVAAAARDAGGDPGQCAAFLDYCLAEQPDVKREDAWRLLTGLAGGRLLAGAARPRPALPLTHYQQVWELAARGATVHGVHVPDLDALRCLQLLSGDFPAFYRRLCLQLIAADAAGAAFEELSGAGTGEIAERALEAARARGLAGAIPLRALLHFDLAARAEGAELARADLLTLLVRSYRHEPGSVPREHAITLLGEVPAFAAARALVARCRHHLAELGRHDERLREERVTPAAVADLLRRRWPAGYQRGAAQDRGFASMPAVVKAARPLVPYLVAGADVPELGLLADLPPEWRSAPHLPALHR